jgi:transcriptional regulator GlxA family with amidase domain
VSNSGVAIDSRRMGGQPDTLLVTGGSRGLKAVTARAGLSERSFYRKFTEATGKTPAHFVESLRLDAARTLLAQGLPLKAIAGKVGLSSPARLGHAFERRFGVPPSLFREMHRAA